MTVHTPIDLCITGQLPHDRPDILAKLQYQCAVLNAINRAFPALNLRISMKSGYRPVSWEKSRGRSGNSTHTYEVTMGALDLICGNWELFANILRMDKELIPWTRIAVYEGKGFVHCDHMYYTGEPTTIDEKRLYNGRWFGMNANDFLDTVASL